MAVQCGAGPPPFRSRRRRGPLYHSRLNPFFYLIINPMDWQKWIKWAIFAIKMVHFCHKNGLNPPRLAGSAGKLIKWIGRRISWDPARSAKLNEFPLLIREGGSPRRPRRAPRPRELKLFPLFVQNEVPPKGTPAGRGPAAPDPSKNGLEGGSHGIRPDPRNSMDFHC